MSSPFKMHGDELGPCPCGHRQAMCHRVNAATWCPGAGDDDPYASGVRAANAALQEALGAAEVRVKELEAGREAHSAEGAEMRGSDEALARLLRWVDITTHPVASEHGPSNDEQVEVRASVLYNLLHARAALSAALPPVPVGPDGEAAEVANSTHPVEIRGKADA